MSDDKKDNKIDLKELTNIKDLEIGSDEWASEVERLLNQCSIPVLRLDSIPQGVDFPRTRYQHPNDGTGKQRVAHLDGNVIARLAAAFEPLMSAVDRGMIDRETAPLMLPTRPYQGKADMLNFFNDRAYQDDPEYRRLFNEPVGKKDPGMPLMRVAFEALESERASYFRENILPKLQLLDNQLEDGFVSFRAKMFSGRDEGYWVVSPFVTTVPNTGKFDYFKSEWRYSKYEIVLGNEYWTNSVEYWLSSLGRVRSHPPETWKYRGFREDGLAYLLGFRDKPLLSSLFHS